MTKKRKAAKSSAKRKATKRSVPGRRTARAVTRSPQAAVAVATSARRSAAERVAALTEVPLAVCESQESLQAMLAILRSEDEPANVRLATLQSLQAASFSVVAFESCRSDYIATLRTLVEDPDLELRQRVLGILAREKDGFVQKKLLAGLENPENALVSPEKALQLLSYDVHAEAYSAARAIVNEPPNPVARREALRLLAADSTAAPLFETLLRDKDELAEIRQISASALQALKPEKMQSHAREMLLDTSEYDDIQATSLTALTQFGKVDSMANDEALLNSVDRMRGNGSRKVKQTARRFLSKYGR